MSGDGFVVVAGSAAGPPLEEGSVCRLTLSARRGAPLPRAAAHMTWARAARRPARPRPDQATRRCGPSRRRCGRDGHCLRLAPRRSRGTCSSRSRGCRPTARRSRGRRSSAAPSPIVSEAAAAGGRARAVGRRRPTRGWRSPCSRPRSTASERRDAGRRHHRHQRQDDHGVSDRVDFRSGGIRCGVLGTVGYRIGDEVREATHTTPEAPEVQALLREMVDRRLRRLRDGSLVARAVAAAASTASRSPPACSRT